MVAGASALAAAYNDNENPLSPPTALKNIDRDITTDEVLDSQLHSLASHGVVEIKSDNNNKKGFSLVGVKVYVINGDNEENPGKLRKVTEEAERGGYCTLEGKQTQINCRLFAILRDELGKQIEKKYLDSKSRRDLLFVDSFDDIDFEEKTKKMTVWKTVDTYVLGSNGRVVKATTRRFAIYCGKYPVLPVSVLKEVHDKGFKWFDEEYPDLAQEYAKKGEEVTQEVIEEEFERRGVSTLLCCDIFLHIIVRKR